MKLTGKATLIKKLAMTTGNKANGEQWKRIEAVFQTGGEYPKQVVIQGFNERADLVNELVVGSEYQITAGVQSREYNGKYYTNLNFISAVATTPNKSNIQQSDQTGQNGSDLPF